MKLAMAVLSALFFSLFIPAAHADSVITFTASNVEYASTFPVETANSTFTYDLTTNQFIGTPTLTMTGPFDFGGPFIFNAAMSNLAELIAEPEYDTGLDFMDPAGDQVRLYTQEINAEFDTLLFPDPGMYYANILQIDCVRNAATEASNTSCFHTFGFFDGGAGKIFVVSPEPQTWMLLLAGIFALLALLKLDRHRSHVSSA